MVDEFEDEVEADLQRFYGVDYRDRFRPGGGESRLTLRRLGVLLQGLPMESDFYSAKDERPPISEGSVLLLDLFQVLTGKPHPRPKALVAERERVRRDALIRQKREQARAFNRMISRK